MKLILGGNSAFGSAPALSSFLNALSPHRDLKPLQNRTQTGLRELGIEDVNSGAYCGTWLDAGGKTLESFSPSTVIVNVSPASSGLTRP